MDNKFNLEEIEKTFTAYKKGQIFDGVVVSKREDGVIFNIGGKNDAFILADDFDDYDEVKIGERFKVLITKQKNEQGFIEASKREAVNQIIGTQNAEKLRLKGKGIENVNSKRKGDMYVITKVIIPEKLTKEQRKIFEQLQDTELENTSFIKKFKKFLKSNMK